MKNVEITMKGTIATVTIDTSKRFGPSSTGKTTIVGSTEGNITIPGTDVKLGVNAYVPKS